MYFCSLVATILLIVAAVELSLEQFLPDNYRGYLIEGEDAENAKQVKWAIGPYEPAHESPLFNEPVTVDKPEGTLRIVSLGASATAGWLSAKAVFSKYGQEWNSASLSSYSRALEFSLNDIAAPASDRIEVINLGVAAFNVTDVIRMLKDSMRLKPDMLMIYVGQNEAWTSERSRLPDVPGVDAPYFYSELGYDVFSDTRAMWQSLTPESAALSPVVLSKARQAVPIVVEPAGRSAGLEQRLAAYKEELQRLRTFLLENEVPVLFVIPTQNVAGFEPFGSMARPGTTKEELKQLNDLLLEALAATGADAKDKLLKVQALDDGIAEANFQLAQIYVQENEIEKARALFWKANDRDMFLKRAPRMFHDATREFVAENNFPNIDAFHILESNSATGVVGNNIMFDDVHPHRAAQFMLAEAIANEMVQRDMLAGKNFQADLSAFPVLGDYNVAVGFDNSSAAKLDYLTGAHNFFIFGRYLERMRWDPLPERFLQPVLDSLDAANRQDPMDNSLYLAAGLNYFLERNEEFAALVDEMNCSASAERAAEVSNKMGLVGRRLFSRAKRKLGQEMLQALADKGCTT